MHRPWSSTPHRIAPVLGAGLALVASVVLTVGAPGAVQAATSSISLYLSAPGVEGPSLSGLTLEDFASYDSVNALSPSTLSTSTSLAVGSISAGSMKAAFSGVGASRTDDTAVSWGRLGGSGIGYLDANGSVTISLGASKNYLGFLWLAGDANNTIVLKSGSREVATFATRDIITLIPKTSGTVTANGGATYTKTDYYGSRYHTQGAGPTFTCGTCTEPYAYVHLVAPVGVTFDAIQFRQGSGGGFEFDNLATATYTGAFSFTGLVGVPMDQLTDDDFTVAVNDTLSDSLATNDTILTGSTFSKVTSPSLGSATVSSSGALTFSAGGTSGSTSFDYKVCRPSPSTTCVTATVTITITAGSTTTTAAPTTTTSASKTSVAPGASTTTVAQPTTTTPASGEIVSASVEPGGLSSSGYDTRSLLWAALATAAVGVAIATARRRIV